MRAKGKKVAREIDVHLYHLERRASYGWGQSIQEMKERLAEQQLKSESREKELGSKLASQQIQAKIC